MARPKRKGISAAAWFYGSSFHGNLALASTLAPAPPPVYVSLCNTCGKEMARRALPLHEQSVTVRYLTCVDCQEQRDYGEMGKRWAADPSIRFTRS